jgi:hypothetical protein
MSFLGNLSSLEGHLVPPTEDGRIINIFVIIIYQMSYKGYGKGFMTPVLNTKSLIGFGMRNSEGY